MHTFNEYASFVQAVRLGVCSVGSGSLIRFTRSLLLPYTSLWVTRNGTRKCLRKNWSQVTYLISDWNEKLRIHIWGKKKRPFATLFLPVPSSLHRKKPLLYLFVEERRCIRLFWSLCLFELGILLDVIHKCFAAHHFLQIVCILWLWLWGETVRMGSLLWPWQGRTCPLWKKPQAKFIPMCAELVCLLYFAKKSFPPASFLAVSRGADVLEKCISVLHMCISTHACMQSSIFILVLRKGLKLVVFVN